MFKRVSGAVIIDWRAKSWMGLTKSLGAMIEIIEAMMRMGIER